MKKDEYNFKLIVALACLMILGNVVFALALKDMDNDVVETNRLLSEFHRIDTVKDKPFCGLYLKPDEQLSIAKKPDFQAETTVNVCACDGTYDSCEKCKPSSKVSNDPNACYHWSSDCEDPDDCKSICHMHPEP